MSNIVFVGLVALAVAAMAEDHSIVKRSYGGHGQGWYDPGHEPAYGNAWDYQAGYGFQAGGQGWGWGNAGYANGWGQVGQSFVYEHRPVPVPAVPVPVSYGWGQAGLAGHGWLV